MMDEIKEIKSEHQPDADEYYNESLNPGFILRNQMELKTEPISIFESTGVGVKLQPTDEKANHANAVPENALEFDDEVSHDPEVIDTLQDDVQPTQNLHGDNNDEDAEGELFCCASCRASFSDEKAFLKHIKHSCFKNLFQIPATAPVTTPRRKKHQGNVNKKGIRSASRLGLRSGDTNGDTETSCPSSDSNRTNSLQKKSVASARRKNFVCNICGRSFALRQNRDNHVMRHSDVKKNKCEMCGKEFQLVGDVRRHMLTAHKVAGDFECADCAKRFMRLDYFKKHTCKPANEKEARATKTKGATKGRKEAQLVVHMTSHEAEKKWKCKVCDKGFRFQSLLRDHMRRHTVVKRSVSFECPVCKRNFLYPSGLKWHMIGHTGKKNFACNICSKSFTNKSLLKQHMLTHGAEKNQKCTECPKKFVTIGQLKKHLIIHTGEKNFSCNVCGKSFAMKGTRDRHLLVHGDEKKQEYDISNGTKGLKCHMLGHTREKDCACNICSKSLNNKSSVNKHMLTHGAEKNEKCAECAKTFATAEQLKQHLVMHTGDMDFLCNVCGKSFIKKSSLSKHMLTHGAERNQKCSECEKAFVTTAQLKQHLIMHTGKNNFLCHVCGKTFAMKGNRDRHILVHGDEKKQECDICDKVFLFTGDFRRHKRFHKGIKGRKNQKESCQFG